MALTEDVKIFAIDTDSPPIRKNIQLEKNLFVFFFYDF